MILDQIAKLDKVLILGFAREGQSTYQFLRQKFPSIHIDIADQKTPRWIPDDPNVSTNFGENYLKIVNCKLVIKSPGVSPHKPEIVAAKKAGTVFTSHMQIFFEVCPSRKTISVTGTKGKSTTASLIYHVLHQNAVPSVLVGNIGRPALDFLPEITARTWVVTELSSYQLMDLAISPHIAVLQAIYPDHLDYHQNFDEYVNAKLNITKYQSSEDYLICHESHTGLAAKAQKYIIRIPNPIIPSPLMGLHNQLNIQPAVIIGKLIGLTENQILSAVSTFKPLETRLEFIAEKQGIRFYADTLATIPEAAVAAIDTLHPATLIAGGHDRRQDYRELAKKIVDSGIRTLILFPATGQRIAQAVGTGSQIKIFHVNSMEEAAKLAFAHTPSGSVCLISPAAPSFTLFKDYKDEYSQYKHAISTRSSPS